jgi:hypothetical protein
MENFEREQKPEIARPACFGSEGKFMEHLEAEEDKTECAGCPSENDCGEFILFKCSRELMF